MNPGFLNHSPLLNNLVISIFMRVLLVFQGQLLCHSERTIQYFSNQKVVQ